jgi:hypothetical protein
MTVWGPAGGVHFSIRVIDQQIQHVGFHRGVHDGHVHPVVHNPTPGHQKARLRDGRFPRLQIHLNIKPLRKRFQFSGEGLQGISLFREIDPPSQTHPFQFFQERREICRRYVINDARENWRNRRSRNCNGTWPRERRKRPEESASKPPPQPRKCGRAGSAKSKWEWLTPGFTRSPRQSLEPPAETVPIATRN